MRKILITLILIFTMNMSYSQEGIGKNRENFIKAQFNEVCRALDLSSDRIEELRPIYFGFHSEMNSARGKRPAPKMAPIKPNDKELDSLNRSKLVTGVKIATLRLEYYDKFRNVLSPSEIDEMYRVEREVMQRINKEFIERRGMQRRERGERGDIVDHHFTPKRG